MKRILSIAALLLIATAGMAQEEKGKTTCIPFSIVCKDIDKPDYSGEACGKNMQEIMEQVEDIAMLIKCEN